MTWVNQVLVFKNQTCSIKKKHQSRRESGEHKERTTSKGKTTPKSERAQIPSLDLKPQPAMWSKLEKERGRNHKRAQGLEEALPLTMAHHLKMDEAWAYSNKANNVLKRITWVTQVLKITPPTKSTKEWKEHNQMAPTNSTKQFENLPTISMKNFFYNPPKTSLLRLFGLILWYICMGYIRVNR